MRNDQEYPLAEIAHVVRGVTFSRSEGESAPFEGALPVIRAGNVQDNLILNDDLVWVPGGKISKKQIIKENDLVMCTSSGSAHIVGKCARAESDWIGSFGAFCVGIRSKEKVCDSGYLFHFLRSPAFRNWSRKSGGANIKNIRKSELEEFKIPLPPLPEQRRIAAILDKADAIRRKRQQAIRLTEEFLRSVFLDMFGDPVLNPKGWEVKRLDEISDIQSGITKGRKANGQEMLSVPYMRVANVQDGHIDLGEIKEIEATSTEIARYQLQKGDILLTEGGDPDKLGRGAVWHGEIDPCIHQNHIFRVRPNTEFLLPEYASAQIGSIRGKKYFLKSAKQTTGIASINKTQLSGFPALIPPVALQGKFVEIVSKQVELVKKNGGSATSKDACFNSLVQRAFRGKL